MCIAYFPSGVYISVLLLLKRNLGSGFIVSDRFLIFLQNVARFPCVCYSVCKDIVPLRVVILNESFLEDLLDVFVSPVESNVPSMDVCMLF